MLAAAYCCANGGTALLALQELHAAAWQHDSVGSTTAGQMEQLADRTGSTPQQAECTTTLPSGGSRRKQSDELDKELT